MMHTMYTHRVRKRERMRNKVAKDITKIIAEKKLFRKTKRSRIISKGLFEIKLGHTYK